MAAIFRASETWRAPNPGDVRTMHVTAGVTRVTAIQITNSSGGELWLSQGSVPPRTPDDADFIVPPRATGNYPLDSEQVSVRWNGQVQDALDFIAFAFTDQVVTPAVYPGVEPVKFPPPTESPIQSRTGSYAFPFYPTTLSGKRIGVIQVYNPTHREVNLYTTSPTTQSYRIYPYTWRTVAINADSGSVMVWVNNEPPTGDTSLSFIEITWTDVDNAQSIPMGTGSLPNRKLYENVPYYNTFTRVFDMASPQTQDILAIPANSQLILSSISLGLTITNDSGLGAVSATANLVLPNGMDGVSGGAGLAHVRVIAPAVSGGGITSSETAINEMQTPITVYNYGLSSTVVRMASALSAPSVSSLAAFASLRGWWVRTM